MPKFDTSDDAASSPESVVVSIATMKGCAFPVGLDANGEFVLCGRPVPAKKDDEHNRGQPRKYCGETVDNMRHIPQYRDRVEKRLLSNAASALRPAAPTAPATSAASAAPSAPVTGTPASASEVGPDDLPVSVGRATFGQLSDQFADAAATIAAVMPQVREVLDIASDAGAADRELATIRRSTDAAVAEAQAERERAERERDRARDFARDALAEREEANTERDRAVEERGEAVAERDRAVEERDRAVELARTAQADAAAAVAEAQAEQDRAISEARDARTRAEAEAATVARAAAADREALEQLRAAHRSDLDQLRSEQRSDLDRLRAEHATQMGQLQEALMEALRQRSTE